MDPRCAPQRVLAVHAPDQRPNLGKQLVELFGTHPALGGRWFHEWDVEGSAGRLLVPIAVGTFKFLPFISHRLKMYCHLDILFLRPAAPGSIVGQGGDIDNRLKILFDGLRTPLQENELPTTDSPGFNETPFLCLLENDDLITGFSVTTERLLKRPSDAEQTDAYVRLLLM